MSRACLISCSSLLAVLATAAPASADGPYEGQWREGPMSIRVTVESWGSDCGPRPQSTSSGGGGAFRISQAGDQLTFHRSRQQTTRSCWSENRAVRRVSSTYQAGTWRVVCRTPPDDSRGETGTYTIRAIGDNQLSFRDQSRYDWQLNTSRCQASIVATQNFTRVGGGAATPTPTPEEPATPRCTPGAPARVVLRPSTSEVDLGGEQCFTARVVDAEGCTVRSTRPRLSLASGSPGELRGNCFHASNEDGSAQVIATAGRLNDTARVSVHAMDLSDLIARRSESGSTSEETPEGDATSTTAARISTGEADEEGIGLLWPMLALLAALLMVGVAVFALRRKPAPRAKTNGVAPAKAAQAPAPAAAGGTTTEPSGGDGSAAAASGDSFDPFADDAPSGDAIATAAPSGDDMICPTCRRGYRPGETRCPHDDATLMPYKDFAAGKSPSGTKKQHVCPTCGEIYPPTVVFCGKDGATLVERDGP